jgi:isocitrate lyase
MGYKFQFIALAGFHSLNFGMYELARNYKDRGMTAYSELQQAEFEAEKHGYTAVRHQREVGTGYFDLVTLAITGRETEEIRTVKNLRIEFQITGGVEFDV